MCGIFGLVSARERQDLGAILVEAGQRLAYRGYDSVGCATVNGTGVIDLRKDVGRVAEVSERLRLDQMRGQRGIVQLRWATFGAPSHRNAQPHLDCDGDMVGAHNGNVVNNVQLQDRLVRQGHTLRGTNDGETCVHAVEHHFDRNGGDMVDAIRQAYDDLAGDYALLITHCDENRLYAIKKGSGLVAGLGPDFTCASSDLPSILPLTRTVLRVHDGEILVLSPEGVRIIQVDTGQEVDREPVEITESMESVTKGGYPHFMLKEIHEQPTAAAELLHLLDQSVHVDRFLEILRASEPVFLVGCGTSYHACLLGAYYLNQIAGRLTVPMLPGQFITRAAGSVGARAAAVFVSQSGETKDVLNAVKVARSRACRTLGVLNVIGSTLTHASETYLPLACGYEISVPATKTFMNQALLFLYLAYRLADRDPAALDAVPGLLESTIAVTDAPARRVAETLAAWDELYYLGYGITEPIALEGALKLKEITYTHCEGIFSAEFKHGPLSAVRA
ncbi:MAG: isomerizing glutamine--fructose-6-phosphate transaminase, partial [Chloroflexi bacterium]|nr:isomerizing glutamine--fructose-6-phosphate transaminase [Chloroflexota bacterium]